MPSQVANIHNVWKRVHSATGLPFPQTVSALLALGVTRYTIDYVASTATSYIADSSSPGITVDVASIPSHTDAASLPSVKWDQSALKDAIRRAQRGESNYPQFAGECIGSGVIGYVAFLTGKRVMYLGSEGDFHVEWFPGAEPKE